VKFLVDAQLPRQLALLLGNDAHDALHTLDLPGGNRTLDAELCDICEREQRVLVTKDLDFTDSFLLKRQPAQLLLISTGNIGNRELEALVRARLPDIEAAFASSSFIELDRDGIIVHA
jgi:predicted nuclease of predicted toxin-antitoxin system